MSTATPKTQAVRVGLVGAGYWARTMHAPLHSSGQHTTLTGVWSPHPERARQLAADFGVSAFESFRQLLDASEAVDFAVPPAIQAELAVEAAEAGKALMLEKPLGAALAQAEYLVRAVTRYSVPTIVVFTKRFHSRTRDFLAAAAERASSSPPIAVTARYMHGALLGSSFLDPSARGGWRQDLGVLFDLGPHLLDLVDAASGPIVRILASGDPREAVMLTTEHASGAGGQLVLSGRVATETPLTDVNIYSHAGDLHYTTSGMDHDEVWPTLRAEFASAVRAGTRVTVDAQRALTAQRLVEASRLSLARNRPVEVADLSS
jgi:predicted dehydrogenase